MTRELGELLAALPPEADVAEADAQRQLAELIAGLAQRPTPVNRLARFWVLGSAHAKIALAYLVHWIRSSYLSADALDRDRNEVQLRAAIKLVGSMGYLRGVMVKVGQTLAAYPHVLPKTYAEAFGRLHFEAPPMHFALVREQLARELGDEPERVFAEFEREAFAAASLGQVHRARLRSGERVAVKVQYPNIARTIDADLRNLLALMAPLRLTRQWSSLRQLMDEIRVIVTREADYASEALFFERARELFRAEDGIVVPRVVRAHSTSRALTMEYVEGVHLEAYLRGNPPQAERDRFGERIMRASFRIAHTGRFWYADSNPGNYLFMRDGRIGVLDFGCCREFSAEEWQYYVETLRASVHGGEALRRAVLRGAGFDPEHPPSEPHERFLVELGEWYSGYLKHEGPFDFADEAFIRRGIEMLTLIGRKGYFQSLPVNVWISRQLLGLRALAYRLGARIDMRRLMYEESAHLLEGA